MPRKIKIPSSMQKLMYRTLWSQYNKQYKSMHDETKKRYFESHRANRNARDIHNSGKILLTSNEILDVWKKGSIMPTYKKLCHNT
jgi:ribosomal protein S4